jgi:hypothetical protein
MPGPLEDRKESQFANLDLTDSTFRRVRFNGSLVHGADFRGVRMRGVELVDVEIDGEVDNLVINGVDVAPIINAELDRRDPERTRMRATDPAGFLEAWNILERRWDATVDRARELDPDQLHVQVDGEWSFIETLRHLVFATDAWVRRGIQGDPSPWDPLDLPWDQMPDTPGIPRDREVRPSLDEVLELRRDRRDGVRALIEGATQEWLDSLTEPVQGPGWPPAEAFPVRTCLRVVLNEEWHHRTYAERDLDALSAD